MKSWKESKTFIWGHAQVIAGGIVTALGYVTPGAFPNIPVWMYGVAAMVAGLITYYLRSITTEAVRTGPVAQSEKEGV